MSETKQETVERRVIMGLGEAVLRLIHVEKMYADGVDPGELLIAERNLIVEALNEQFRLDLGLDCDQDGIPDAIDDVVEIRDVGIFKVSAETSCCRIIPEEIKNKTRTVAVTRNRAKKADKPEPPKLAPQKVEFELPPAKVEEPKPSRGSRKSAPPVEAPVEAPAKGSKKKGLFGNLFGTEKE